MGDTFQIGDTVDVLNVTRLPKVVDIRHTGTIERITQSSGGYPLYWISGRGVAATALELRRHGGESTP